MELPSAVNDSKYKLQPQRCSHEDLLLLGWKPAMNSSKCQKEI